MSTHLPHRSIVWIQALTVAWILVVLTTSYRVTFAAEPDYASELPRIQPLSPKAALDSFRIQPGFRIEQVACEPMVTDPIAMAFDEQGRLFVVEMRGYSEDENLNLGRIRRLTDKDGDGVFDHATTYVDQLSWPTAIACYNGGVYVGVAPDIRYYRDQDDDGRADEERVVYSGFGRGNVQGLLNSFHWNLDHQLYGATSSSGATLDTPDGEKLSLRGRDFAFDPKTEAMIPVSGGAQHGLSINGWGERFVCSNSDHLQYVVFDDRYLVRNPFLAAPSPRISIATDGPQAPVFRQSPVEPWRIVRTRLRVAGEVPGPVEGGGTPAGYFTGATGVTIYRGNAWPHEDYQLAYVCDVGSNLVHRKRLQRQGLRYSGSRIDEGDEFLTSTDIWFRPVQLANAPDGTLYIADMYREVIEHPASLPPIIKKHLDLTSGRDRGRIYRIVPDNFQQPALPKLHEASARELVATLDHANDWHRETAARLLYEQGWQQAEKDLQKMVRQGKHPEARIRALRALQAADALPDPLLLTALKDSHEQVRRHAIECAESQIDSPAIRERLAAMVQDESMPVRFQLAFSLGGLELKDRLGPLVDLALDRSNDLYLDLAIQSSLASGAGPALIQIVESPSPSANLVSRLARQISQQQDKEDLQDLAGWLQNLPPDRWRAAATVLTSLRPQPKSELQRAMVREPWKSARRNVLARAHQLLDDHQPSASDDKTSSQLTLAVRALTLGDAEREIPRLRRLLSPTESSSLQQLSLQVMGQFTSNQVAEALVDEWPQLTPQRRRSAFDTIVSRPAWQEILLTAIESGKISASELDFAKWRSIVPDGSATQQRIERLATSLNPDRERILEEYRVILETKGDVTAGAEVFKKNCSSCHRVGDVGYELGPNLAAMRNRGPDAILTNVLVPNREVNPQYLNYVATTSDGRVISGMLTSETGSSITLRSDNQNAHTLTRAEIEELRSTGKSIMPEGLEAQIDKAAMANLLSFLMQSE